MKRIRKMAAGQSGTSPDDLDDIEADRMPKPSLSLQPEMRGIGHVALFSEIDGFARKAQTDMRSRTHLDKNQKLVIRGDQVDLPSSLPHVGSQNPVAA